MCSCSDPEAAERPHGADRGLQEQTAETAAVAKPPSHPYTSTSHTPGPTPPAHCAPAGAPRCCHTGPHAKRPTWLDPGEWGSRANGTEDATTSATSDGPHPAQQLSRSSAHPGPPGHGPWYHSSNSSLHHRAPGSHWRAQWSYS